MPQDHPTGFRPPCALRMSPVNALQHIGELRRRDDNNAIGRRGPDKLAALQPLGVKRHAQTVMPKHLHEVAPASTEHEEITGVRIALQRLLHLQSEAVHATAHVGMARRDPHPHARGNGNHRRGSAFITAAADQDQRRRKYAGERRAQTPARSAACPPAPWAVSVVRPAQIARSQQA